MDRSGAGSGLVTLLYCSLEGSHFQPNAERSCDLWSELRFSIKCSAILRFGGSELSFSDVGRKWRFLDRFRAGRGQLTLLYCTLESTRFQANAQQSCDKSDLRLPEEGGDTKTT